MPDIIHTQAAADLLATDAIIGNARASKFKHFAFGGAAIAAVAGATAVGLVWASTQKHEAEALNRLLEKVPTIKVEGTVTATGDVGIKPGSTVTVIVPAPPPAAAAGAPVLPGAPASSSAIKRTVTVFNYVQWGKDGAIVTGWDYPTGDAKVPIDQFCYLIRTNTAENDGSGIRDNLGKNGQPIARAAKKFGTAYGAMFDKCIWFAGETPSATNDVPTAAPEPAPRNPTERAI